MMTSAGWLWIYAGCGLMLAELLAPGFIIFFFGLAAATVGALVLILPEAIAPNLTWQLALFSVFSVAYLLGLRRYMKKVFCGDTGRATALADELVGRTGAVTAAIRPNVNGRVRIGDAEWDAKAAAPLAAGTDVRVVKRVNLTLEVAALESTGSVS